MHIKFGQKARRKAVLEKHRRILNYNSQILWKYNNDSLIIWLFNYCFTCTVLQNHQ